MTDAQLKHGRGLSTTYEKLQNVTYILWFPLEVKKKRLIFWLWSENNISESTV